jgi:hypothetical protein
LLIVEFGFLRGSMGQTRAQNGVWYAADGGGSWGSRVVDLVEGIFEASQGLAGEGAACAAGGFGDALAVFFGQASGLGEKLLGVLLQGADPELFGTLKILIEIGPVALEAFGEP